MLLELAGTAVKPYPPAAHGSSTALERVVHHTRDQTAVAGAHQHLHRSRRAPEPVIARLAPSIVVDERPADLAPRVVVRPYQRACARVPRILLAKSQRLDDTAME